MNTYEDDDVKYSYFISPDQHQLAVRALITSSMVLFYHDIQKEIDAGRNIKVKREEQNTASALLRVMGRCSWERQ
jgi:hypothetical protein